MPKNILSLKPKQLIRLLEEGGCTFYREGKGVITVCILVLLMAKRELSQLIWEQERCRLPTYCEFLGSSGLQMNKLRIY